MIAQISAPVAMLLAGPLADRVFEPAMREGGALTPIFGGLVGTGTGAGMALMMVITGILGVIVGASGSCSRRSATLSCFCQITKRRFDHTSNLTAVPLSPGELAHTQVGRGGTDCELRMTELTSAGAHLALRGGQLPTNMPVGMYFGSCTAMRM